MTRGELARRAGCNIETIRYYEKIGMLPAPPRSTGGHRVYDEVRALRLAFIIRGRALGFGIDELRDLLALVDRKTVTCEAVRQRTVRHLNGVRARIRALQRLERVLRRMADRCPGGAAPDCPIIGALSGDSTDRIG